jgi:polyphosphate glucokinase
MAHGAGKGRDGVVLMLTLGTGIGSALFIDGILVPNTELGHLELHGHDAETKASVSAREREELSWEHWVHHRLQKYIDHVAFLFSPELIIVGGGISKKPEKWFELINQPCECKVAELKNNAGIVGAAMYASTHT